MKFRGIWSHDCSWLQVNRRKYQSLRKENFLRLFSFFSLNLRLIENVDLKSLVFFSFKSCHEDMIDSQRGQTLSWLEQLRWSIIYFILTKISDRIGRMKNSYGNFFIQSQSRIDFLTRGKSRFIQSEISCQNESVSSQTRPRFFRSLFSFNLHSQKFVEFPQVYSSFLENLP